jgi:hypothetical protein
LRPVKGLAGALVVLLVCSVGLTAVNLLFEFLVEDWGRPSAGAGVSVLQGILNALSSGASIALIIVFCMWLYRVLRNAEQRHPEAGLNPGWAVGSFFVPFVHLVLPYFEVRRGWRADVSPDSGPVTAWFVPWALGMAATYVTVILVVSISSRTVSAATRSTTPDLDAFYDQTHSLQLVAGAVGLVLNALAAFFLAQMARRWTAVQEGPPVS